MGAFFALGAACFVIGPIDAYATGVGADADSITFFVGSILFTLGGLTQCWLALPERRLAGQGVGAWRAAWVQSIGTLLFNLMTLEAIGLAAASADYEGMVWWPNALGSVCFVISGAFLYLSSPRRRLLPDRRHHGWWEPSVNGLGCVLFGASAIAGYVISSKGEMISSSAANWTTTLGAVCFLIVALAALATGYSFKVPRLRRLRELEQVVERDLERAEQVVVYEFLEVEQVVERDLDHVAAEVEIRARILGEVFDE